MNTSTLREVDSLEITVIVDNELDPFSSSPNPAVQQPGRMSSVQLPDLNPPRAGALRELRMDSICCAAHGLSLMITARTGEASHTLLFDAGPEGHIWERNAARMKLNLAMIDHIHLSHWHPDHSGGLPTAVRLIKGAKDGRGGVSGASPPTVDLHPDRPDFRGFRVPTGEVISMEADPEFQDIETAGGVVSRNASTHSIMDGTFLVSGAIPRVTAYEGGIRGGMRLVDGKTWIIDEAIADERFVMCNLKGKGIVVFSGCSHAGVVNVSRHAKELGKGLPLYCVVGGFHLADADAEKMKLTMRDLKALEPKVLLPGHCTGWRFKHLVNTEMPTCMVPSFVGTRYVLQ